MNTTPSLPLRTLLRIVHHRRPADEPAIALVLRLAALSVLVRQQLENLLNRLGLSGRGFATLVALYTFDPEPVSPEDLGHHIDAAPATVTAALGPLIRSGHIVPAPEAPHRGPTRVMLTPAGRDLAAQAVDLLLEAAGRISRHLPHETCASIATLCDALQDECRAAAASVAAADSAFVP